MEGLRNWALTVALAALAGGIVRLVTPRGGVQKAVRTVVAVFLLSAFLSPLWSGRGFSIDWIMPEMAEAPTIPGLDDTVSKQVQAAVEDELRARIGRVLALREVDGQILIETDILSDGSIDIVSAKVICARGTGISGLAAAIEADTGLEVEIVKE